MQIKLLVVAVVVDIHAMKKYDSNRLVTREYY